MDGTSPPDSFESQCADSRFAHLRISKVESRLQNAALNHLIDPGSIVRRDHYPDFENLLYAFIGASPILTREEAIELIGQAEIKDEDPAKVLEVLMWVGFLGTINATRDETTFSYQVRYNVERLLAPLRAGRASLVIHPAFRQALGMKANA